MYNATISADIIASTALVGVEVEELSKKIHWLFDKINEYQKRSNKENVYSRLVSGDLIESLIMNPQDALRIALIIKTGIKSFLIDDKYGNIQQQKYRKLFQTYGIRVAIGIGEMNTKLLDKDILNGEAIFRSGRLISEQKTSNKERIVVKNTLFFDSPSKIQVDIFSTLMILLDELLNKTTQKQSNILLLKLLGHSETDIAEELKIKQSSVNQQSRAAGWNAIEQAVRFYSNYDFSM